MPERFAIDHWALVPLLRQQDGVVARRQLLGLGATPSDVDRLVRRRDLVRAYDGIYVDHTGPLTPRQREWVAVLAAWPAVLADESALPGPRPGDVRIAVAHGRSLLLPPGVRMRRVVDLDGRALWQRSPPRMRPEDALIDVMVDRVAAEEIPRGFAALADAVTARATTPHRVLDRLALRTRVRGRRVIEGMLTDARDGVCSVLERGYLQRVERPHGLPRAVRQAASRATGGLTLQDARYEPYGFVVELDGTLGHTSAAARDQDSMRDLAEMAIARRLTTRITYGVVFDHGCRAAHLIGQILRERGWPGSPRRCPRCPR